MTAVIYARYSRTMQSAASIPDQQRTCERLAARHDFTVVARFSDAAISGGHCQSAGISPGGSDREPGRRHRFWRAAAIPGDRLPACRGRGGASGAQGGIGPEGSRKDRVIPRLRGAFREMVADLHNATKRDVDRARATIRQDTGNSIKVESDGETVRFLRQAGDWSSHF